MVQRNITKKLFQLSVLSASILGATAAYGSAFQNWEQTGFGSGDYHAGAAAEGDDASLEFYNPAQITRLKHQEVSVGAAVIPVRVHFKGTVDTALLASGTSSTVNVIPNFHYVAPLSDRFFFAFGVTTPFGLETNYPSNNPNLAFAATKTELLTLNFNPSIAFKATNWLSLAVGFDTLYGSATYNNVVLAIGPFKNNLSGFGFGYNAGLLFTLTPETRLGLSYRSEIKIAAGSQKGSSIHDALKSSPTTMFPLPATTMLSIYQGINKRLSLMGTATYTQWSEFSVLTLNDTAIGDLPVHEDYRNTWNLALGAHVRMTKTFTWKVGGGYDWTPTRIGYRDIRLPDANRWALSTGFHWQVLKALGLELGYTHLFPEAAKIDNSKSSALSPFNEIPAQIGKATMNANVIAGQITWTIG